MLKRPKLTTHGHKNSHHFNEELFVKSEPAPQPQHAENHRSKFNQVHNEVRSAPARQGMMTCYMCNILSTTLLSNYMLLPAVCMCK